MTRKRASAKKAGSAFETLRGKADPGQQLVIMTMSDLVALLTGQRPPEVLP